jgi:hypothetical protein
MYVDEATQQCDELYTIVLWLFEFPNVLPSGHECCVNIYKNINSRLARQQLTLGRERDSDFYETARGAYV